MNEAELKTYRKDILEKINRYPQDAVKAWYDEVKTVDWKNLEKPDALHFTQLVWKASKKLGIGIGKSGEGFYYLVVNFDPPGNYPGQFNDNVKPKKV
uniref:SCP domain-containing protein n=1 Tax=Panagrellus redivivus TaxID=6233 RepID=A0A7E4UMF1_PANRE